jgi:DNA polymerase-3 subunit gamma/tau
VRPEPEASVGPGSGSSRAAAGRPEEPRPAAGPAEQKAPPRVPLVSAADDVPSPDDVDAADSGLVGRPVVEQLLGGRVIDETDI